MTKLLIVDDEKDVQRLFEQRFRREKRSGQITLHFAFSGKEALQFLKQEVDQTLILLSDINMPQMNGLELLKTVKEQYPHLKVFMITAYGDQKNRQQAFDFGANDYLTKPIDFRGLKEKIFVQQKDD